MVDILTLAAAKAYTDKKSGGGGANFITANSVAELPDPSTVAEGTIALVPSEGGGGLTVVELTTQLVSGSEPNILTEAETAELKSAMASRKPIIVKYNYGEDGEVYVYSLTLTYSIMGDMECYTGMVYGLGTIVSLVLTA